LYRPLTTTKRPAAQAGVGLVVGDAVGEAVGYAVAIALQSLKPVLPMDESVSNSNAVVPVTANDAAIASSELPLMPHFLLPSIFSQSKHAPDVELVSKAHSSR
jgi:hypothetical protein